MTDVMKVSDSGPMPSVSFEIFYSLEEEDSIAGAILRLIYISSRCQKCHARIKIPSHPFALEICPERC